MAETEKETENCTVGAPVDLAVLKTVVPKAAKPVLTIEERCSLPPKKPKGVDNKKTAKKKITLLTLDTPVDLSFMNLMAPKDFMSEEPRNICNLKRVENKYESKSIKLNNNHIGELTDLRTSIADIVVQPDALTWIDLSFNVLPKIEVGLLEFPNLQILYLHGNMIDDVKEVDKLRAVTTLRKLSLHGNPIETIKHYRLYVTAMIPQLINMDMSSITKADRVTADTFYPQVHNVKGKKKAHKDED